MNAQEPTFDQDGKEILKDIIKKSEEFRSRYEKSVTKSKDDLDSIYRGVNNQLERLALITTNSLVKEINKVRADLKSLIDDLQVKMTG